MTVMFHEVRFPEDISFGAVGGPTYSTSVISTMSGGEQRTQNWAQGRIEFDVSHGVKTKEQLDKMITFFRARKGKAFGFRFKDWTDYQSTNQPCVQLTNPRQFQMTKVYVDDMGYSDTRIIRKPVEGTVAVYVNGVLQLTGFSVDHTTGIITFLDETANAVTADCEFDVPMRLDTDKMPITYENSNVYSWGSITLLEINKKIGG